MSFFELARDRYSERNFDSRPVEQEKIDKILEAGRIVPTACNYQPQRFYVLKSEQALATAKTVTPFTYKAPLMILVCYDINTVWTNPQDSYPSLYEAGHIQIRFARNSPSALCGYSYAPHAPYAIVLTLHNFQRKMV